MPQLFGYARVSTNAQTLDAQVEQLHAAGCVRVFHEKMSGAKAVRPELTRLLRVVRAGDTVLVTQMDRFGRKALNLLRLAKQLTERGIHFRALGGVIDTSTPYGRYFLSIQAAHIELDWEMIQLRTQSGRARAMARGVKMGRKRKLSVGECVRACERRERGESLASLAQAFGGVDPATISRALKLARAMKTQGKPA